MSEKRPQDVLTKIERSIAVKIQRAKLAAVRDLLPVIPRSDGEKHSVIIRIFRLDPLVDRDGSVDVFLVPKTRDQHYRNFQRLFRQQLVNCLIAPKRIVRRMFKQLPPKPGLFQTAATPQLAC